MKHYVAFVGPEMIHAPLSQMEETWDFQSPLPTLQDFAAELQAPEETSKIKPETSLIIFFSRLFEQDKQGFAELVSYVAPFSVACILIPDADRHQQTEIERTIRNVQRTRAAKDETYNQNTPFYFVSYENPQEEIYDAINKFCANPVIDRGIVEFVAPMLPQAQMNIEQLYDDFDDTEDLTIPERDPNDESTIIAVTSSKGGSGKSSITMLLASYIAKSSRLSAEQGLESAPLKTIVVDLDVRDGQLGFLNGAFRPSVVDIVASGAPNVDNVRRGIYHNKRTGVDFIFAAKRPRSAKSISSVFYISLLNTLRKMYDVIILDTSVNYLDPLLEEVAYPMSDWILLVSDFSIASIYGMSRWISEMTARPEAPDKNIPKSKVKICLNKAMDNVSMGLDRISKAASDVEIIVAYPSAPNLLTYSGNTNQLDQVLNHRYFNEATRDVVNTVLPDYTFAKVPWQR